jgi:hypothetical protein
MDKIKRILKQVEISEAIALNNYKQCAEVLEKDPSNEYYKGREDAYAILLYDFKDLLANIRFILKTDIDFNFEEKEGFIVGETKK